MGWFGRKSCEKRPPGPLRRAGQLTTKMSLHADSQTFSFQKVSQVLRLRDGVLAESTALSSFDEWLHKCRRTVRAMLPLLPARGAVIRFESIQNG